MDMEIKRRKPKAQLRRKKTLHVSRRTKANSAPPLKVARTLKKLPASQTTERVMTNLIGRASEVIGDKNEALRWMGTPIRALDFATPISLLSTKKGAQRVNDVLGQMEHGIW
jgi:putative toxin-antitoxin system antitoxin component (TIGR02293 family)